MTARLIQLDRRFEWKTKADGSGKFEGYASTFGNEDSSGDTVRKGAFVKSLAARKASGRKLKMLWNHSRMEPIGAFNKAAEDNSGLYVEGQLTLGVRRADEMHLLMLDDVIDSMSIGGYVDKEEYDNKTGKSELIIIDLQEISPVTFEANNQARISTVKTIEEYANIDELEKHLRDVGGFSRTEAKAILAKAKGFGAPLRDAADDTAQVIRSLIKTLQEN